MIFFEWLNFKNKFFITPVGNKGFKKQKPLPFTQEINLNILAISQRNKQ